MNKVLAVCLTAFACSLTKAEVSELNTEMVLNTFKLSDSKINGTAFILSRPMPEDPKKLQTVLLTARHLLANMQGEEATVFLRKKTAEGQYEKAPLKFKIRKGDKKLWAEHTTEDVGAILVSLPQEFEHPNLPVELLASDESLQALDIHPGTIIRCAGYPHAGQFEASPAGFPLVRLGCIASFPLVPTGKTKTFIADFNTFEGDSGSPVYVAEEGYSAGGADAKRRQLIIGLVHGQHFLDEKFKNIYQSGETKHRLGLAIVVHSTAIRETIELLPKN